MKTLAELRRDVADEIGDLVEGTSTSVVAAPANTFEDVRNFVDTMNHFAGADLLITSGASIGYRARITGSSANNTTVTFAPPSPNGIAIGDTCQIFGYKDSIRIEEIDRAIRRCISDAFPNFRLPHVQVLGSVYLPDTLATFALDDEFTHVHSVYVLGTTGTRTKLRAARPGTEGWYLVPGRMIEVTGRSRQTANGQTLEIHGYKQEPPLVADTDTTRADPEWVRDAAAAALTRRGQDQMAMQMGGMRTSRVDALRSKMISPVAPNTHRVIE